MKKIITSFTNPIICNLVYNLQLWLSKLDSNPIFAKNRVYDGLGEIDTLGNSTETTRFTYFYSDEFICKFGIKLPFGYSIEYNNGDFREVLIFKNVPKLTVGVDKNEFKSCKLDIDTFLKKIN